MLFKHKRLAEMKKQKLKEMILGQFKQAGTKKTLKLLFDLIKKRVIRLSK
jgi:hypothetical protein